MRRGFLVLSLLAIPSALLVVACSVSTGTARVLAEHPTNPRSPSDEIKTFQLADPNLQIELVAAEPDVVSPVAIAWDEDAHLYVVEMRDYPDGPPAGRIRLLEDRDHDGRYEQATVFADGLAFPTGVLPWNGGIFVTAAPNIWYFKDTNGDGKADERRVVLTGFGEGNQQLRVNGLYWGLDNWVYGANGRSDGEIRKPEDPPAKAVSIRRHDFRFRPATAELEAIAGFSQFGLARDDWGNRFLSWNTIPIRHAVLEERYLNRNPHLAEAVSVAHIGDPTDLGRVFSIGPPPRTFNREPVNFFNAGCGLTIYRGHLLGEAYRGNAFVCESLTNLVHRRTLQSAGPTFIAKRVEQDKEFLASADSWFHPVNLATGPDGALYVVDFYREMVEHPQFVAENLRQGINFRKGAEHGRIWRIRPKASRVSPMPHLGRASVAELVRHLDHANGWCRDTAQRLLVERQDRKAVPLLKETANKAAKPVTRVHALWTLDGFNGLDEQTLAPALRDQDAPVRETALRLTENRLANSPSLQTAVLAMAADDDRRVRFQCAATLGEIKSPAKVMALVNLAQKDVNSEWIQLAILSSVGDSSAAFLASLVEDNEEWLRNPTPNQARFLSQIAAIIGARNQEDELSACLRLTFSVSRGRIHPASTNRYGQLALLSGLAEGLGRAGRPLHGLLPNPPTKLQQALQNHDSLLHFARQVAGSDQADPSRRVLAIQVLTQTRAKSTSDQLLELLGPRQALAVQTAAARGLAELADRQVIGKVFERWSNLATNTRREMIASLVRSPMLASTVLDAIDDEKVAVPELDASAREALLRIPNADMQKRARELLKGHEPANRQDVLRKYAAAVQLAGNARHGADLFGKTCLQCHQFQGQGYRVGPDLSGIAARPKEALLSDILDPSKEVAPDFTAYLLVTARGQVLTGLLAAETATTIKLRRAENAEDSVLRGEVREFRPTGKSLMPDGLEETLNVQDLADLLEFLKDPISLPAPRTG